MDAQVLGISVDHVPCLKAWAESLGGINYPLLSDFWPHGAIAQEYDVLRREGYTERAIFVLDKSGVIRYIDIHDIDQQPSNRELMDVLWCIDPDVAARVPRIPEDTTPVAFPHGGIVMYCTPWCPDCKRARAWLKENNLPYTEVDINAIPGAAVQVRQWSGGNLTTPTFEIDGEIIVDFNQQKLREVLKL